MGINLSLFFVQEELSQMGKYLDVVASALETNFNSVTVAHEEILQKMEGANEIDEDYVEWILSKHEDEVFEAGKDFPQLLMISFVILWYSFVEQKLLDFCEDLELKITISPKDKKESLEEGIKRARKFLLRAKGYDIDQKHWQELLSIGKLRNLLVHEGKKIELGLVKPEKESVSYKNSDGLEFYIPIDKSLYEYMNKNKLFEVSGVFFDIMPSIEYCKRLVSFGGEIFKKLHYDLRATNNEVI